MLYRICQLFFIFTVFSVGGWVMETLLYLIRDHQAVKRGFLFGPVCPIYGVAAVICDLLIYRNFQNIFVIFIVGFLMSFALEYSTHFVMENLFHAMWWDYSGRRFNLKGRVYLNGLLLFGAGVVLIVKLLLPYTYRLIELIPRETLLWICFAVYSLLLIDVATTISDLLGSVRYIRNFQASIVSEVQKGLDTTGEHIDEVITAVTENEYYKKMISENPMLIRFKKRFPNFTLTRYKFILDIIINNPQENKARKDIKLYGTAETAPKKEENEKQSS